VRVLLDANVLIAAFISHGSCAELFEHCIESHSICVPGVVLEEFKEKLSGKLKFPKKTVAAAASFLKANAELVESGPLPSAVCRDPEDDAVLAAAGKAGADCIVTGDKDLLILKKFGNIPILSPAGFWKFEKERKPG
jgi:putative PIN family toxin of toxin-antitoxin system